MSNQRFKETGAPLTGGATGGSYAPTTRGESDLGLSSGEIDRQWGSVENVKVGSRSPWGQADHVQHLADGIVSVSTPGHGGVKLSPERNAEVPAALRNKSGWYEEDCEAAIVSLIHAEDIAGDRSVERVRADADATVRSWMPDGYENAFGVEVSDEESYVRREQRQREDAASFRAAHANEFVSTGVDSSTLNESWVPDGYRVSPATMDATGEKRMFLIPEAEAVKDGRYQSNVLIDTDRHLDVTDVDAVKPDRPWVHDPKTLDKPITSGPALGIKMDTLTPSARERVGEDLNKIYRFRNDDGSTTDESLIEHTLRQGIVGKTVSSYNGRTTYCLEMPNSRVQPVSKSTFDAVTGVPDTTSEVSKAAKKMDLATNRLEAGRRDFNPRRVAKARADLDAARAEYNAIRDRESAESAAWQEDARQLRAEAFEQLKSEKGISFI